MQDRQPSVTGWPVIALLLFSSHRAHSFQEVRLETYSCLVDARTLYGRLNFRMTEVVHGQKAYGKSFDQEFWSLKL
ncbi:hypothetical protein D9M71_596910 [compost metagenome]